MENSKIEWTDHTWNGWIGCEKVSAGCKNCYAEELMDKRYRTAQWGPAGTRKRTSDSYWRKPLAWNKDMWLTCPKCGWRGSVKTAAWSVARWFMCPVCQGETKPTRQRVFCSSLSDVFEDRADLAFWRADLFALIERTPNLDWLLLTKRPENVNEMAPWGNDWPAHVWMGASVENQEQADKRIPHLVNVPAKVRFLSCEPLLGPIDFNVTEQEGDEYGDGAIYHDLLTGYRWMRDGFEKELQGTPGISWVIAGGESGANARPMRQGWARALRDQCQRAGVPFLFKQWGEYVGGLGRRTEWVSLQNGAYVGGDKHTHEWGDGEVSQRVGKHAAGRLLDGREWNEYPA